jgi:hypothetical protein
VIIGRPILNGRADCIGLGIIGSMSPANSPSSIVDNQAIETLIDELDSFIVILGQDNTLVVHNTIDQFFYMEKAAELRTLVTTIDELQSRITLLRNQASISYTEINRQLSTDKSWLGSYHSSR